MGFMVLYYIQIVILFFPFIIGAVNSGGKITGFDGV
jgi:hypothetical protein